MSATKAKKSSPRLPGKSTAYIERSHLTSRLFNGRQGRKTLAFANDIELYRAAAVCEDAYYNHVPATLERETISVPTHISTGISTSKLNYQLDTLTLLG
jgi:hypothetical protein